MSGEGHLAPRPMISAPLQMRLRSGGKPAKDSAFITCPKCDEPCFIRRSERITEKVKHLEAHCTNTGCGHTFAAQVVFVHSYSPGLIDRPDLDLPVCPREQVPHVSARKADEEDPAQISMFSG